MQLTMFMPEISSGYNLHLGQDYKLETPSSIVK